jgi:hypothetical protein
MAGDSSGCIALWRFTEGERSYPGWNVSADARGIATLLDKLARLRTEGGHRTVQISPPTRGVLQVVNNQRGSAPWVAADRWRIELAPGQESTQRWSFPPDLNTACLSLGEEMLSLLEESVRGIGRHEGDHSMGLALSEERLWFWWWP